MSPQLPPPPPRNWRTPLLLLALAALVAASFASLPLQWSAFFTPEALASGAEFLAGFTPPEVEMAANWRAPRENSTPTSIWRRIVFATCAMYCGESVFVVVVMSLWCDETRPPTLHGAVDAPVGIARTLSLK